MKAIINGKIVLPTQIIEGKALLFDQKIIGLTDDAAQLENAEIIDAKGAYVCPGLVDVHIHGYLNEDTSDGNQEGLQKIAYGLVKNGVTSFLPTTMTVPFDEIEKALDVSRTLKAESAKDTWKGAQILGVHAEGPFINKSKKGAQAESAILAPDAQRVLKHKDIIKVITFAPEVEGGLEFVRQIKEGSDIVLSIGHTNATYEEACAAIQLGANHITHTYNAMTPLNHRNPGVVGAALTNDVYTELIADTFHVHSGIFSLMAKTKGDHMVLITDCVRAGGMPDGEYSLGGQPIFLKGIECRLEDGTIAGSVLRLNYAVKNMYAHGNVSLYEAVRMASLNAAASIGMEKTKGSLEAGKDADIMMMDANCEVSATYIAGRQVF